MQKKKENFLDKVIKKNYNNELELVLEKKKFDENTKNILLNILYKLETAYKDYENVKKNVMPKDEFLQMIISIIENSVDEIDIVKINSEDAKILGDKKFLIDKKQKKIICYPIEKELLYSLSEISKKDKILKDKYYFIDKTISDLLLVGNNINTVEPIRDFNGFSWDTIDKDIESIEYNLIYQNLRILVEAEFLNKWIYNKEFMIDYFELFKIKLEEYYGEKNEENITNTLCKLSVLLEMKYNKARISRMQKSKEELEQKLEEISDKKEFTKKLTKEKKEINRKIKRIDTILNDKNLLQIEYEHRNEQLPLDKKIFSMRVLSNIMKKERESLISKLDKQNQILNPQKFVNYEKKLEDKYKYLQLLDIENTDKEIQKEILQFQKIFLECFNIKIQKAVTKQEIGRLISEFRYYLNLPYGNNKKINDVKALNKLIEVTSANLIQKAIKEKVLIRVSNDEEFNFDLLKNILNTRIINLESINIKITKEQNKIYLQMFDENIFDQKIELGDTDSININNLQVKLNKNIKIFIP